MSLISADDLRDVLKVGASVGDSALDQVVDAAERAVLRYLKATDDNGDPADYSTHSGVLECITSVAVDMWQARVAPGGAAQSLDFGGAPVPMRLSAFNIQHRVQAYCLDVIDAGAWLA